MLSRDSHERMQRREFHWGLGASAQGLCDLQAVRLALASVAPAGRGARTVVHINSPEVADYLTHPLPDDGNKIVIDMRRWYGYYKNITVMMHADQHGSIARAGDLARMGMDTQKEFDSQTQVVK